MLVELESRRTFRGKAHVAEILKKSTREVRLMLALGLLVEVVVLAHEHRRRPNRPARRSP